MKRELFVKGICDRPPQSRPLAMEYRYHSSKLFSEDRCQQAWNDAPQKASFPDLFICMRLSISSHGDGILIVTILQDCLVDIVINRWRGGVKRSRTILYIKVIFPDLFNRSFSGKRIKGTLWRSLRFFEIVWWGSLSKMPERIMHSQSLFSRPTDFQRNV